MKLENNNKWNLNKQQKINKKIITPKMKYQMKLNN